MAELTQARARSLFNYNPGTGELTWRDRPREDFATQRGWRVFQTQCAGKVASAKAVMGANTYLVVRFDGRLHLQHHVIWVYMTGEELECLIDHQDGDGTNNRWDNIRPATYSQNHANRKYQGRTVSGLKGAFYDKKNKRWESRIGLNGKTKFIGRFDTAEDAHNAYMAAAREHYGKFARAL